MSFGLMSFGVMSFGILSVYYIHTLGLTASSKCAGQKGKVGGEVEVTFSCLKERKRGKIRVSEKSIKAERKKPLFLSYNIA